MQIGSQPTSFQQSHIPQKTPNSESSSKFSQAFKEQGLVNAFDIEGVLNETELDPSLLEQQAEQMEQASLLAVASPMSSNVHSMTFEAEQIQEQVDQMLRWRVETDASKANLGASPLQNGSLESMGELTNAELPLSMSEKTPIFNETGQQSAHHKVTIENHLEHAYARQIGVLDEQSIEHDSSLLKDFRQNILTESEILAREGVSLEEGRVFAPTETQVKTTSTAAALGLFNQQQTTSSQTPLSPAYSIAQQEEQLQEILTDSQEMTSDGNISIDTPQDLFTQDSEKATKVQETKSTEQRMNLEKIASQIQFRKEDNEVKELILELHPKHLGSMRMKLSQEGENLSVEMLVGSVEAKQMIESDLASLREMLMKREDMEFQQLQLAVDVEQNPFQRDGQQAEQGGFRENYGSNHGASSGVVEPKPSQVYQRAVSASGLNLYV